MLRSTCIRLLSKSKSGIVAKGNFLRNHDIIFDHVRVIDKARRHIGDMSTSDGIELAKSKKVDLVLIDAHADPPVCQMTNNVDSHNVSTSLTHEGAFSFDPTLRPATIRIAATIDPHELEMKVDILRKHLLEKRRCNVVVVNKRLPKSDDDIRELLGRIIGEVRDIAKIADTHTLHEVAGEVQVHVWPCSPDHTVSDDLSQVYIEDIGRNEIEVSGERRSRRHPHKRRMYVPKLPHADSE